MLDAPNMRDNDNSKKQDKQSGNIHTKAYN